VGCPDLPICPRCHLEISEEHYERHLQRCGTHHKHGPVPLVSTSGGTMGATPYAPYLSPPISYPWWKYGLLVWPPRRLTRRQKYLVVLWYFLLFGGIVTVYQLVLLLLFAV